MKIRYSIFDPTGNITILVKTPVPQQEQASVARALMAREPAAEQVGFFTQEGPALRMAGGEFCGNASLCAAVQAAMEAEWPFLSVALRVSGAADLVTADVLQHMDGSWSGAVDMPRPRAVETVRLPGAEAFSADALPVVRFDGISHVIVAKTGVTEADIRTAEELAPAWCRALGADACGILFLDRAASTMKPLVYVPEAGTLVWENSCASGTAAVCAWLAEEAGGAADVALTQPGGALQARMDADGKLRLRGNVRLLKETEAELSTD